MAAQNRERTGTKAAHTRARIVQAARTLFRAQNYQDVGIREIAEAAGVSTGVVYYHFCSKGEVLLACFDQNDGRFGAELDRIAEADVAVCDKIRRFLLRVMIPTVQADGKELTRYRMFDLKRNSLPDSLLYRSLETAVHNAQTAGELTTAVPAEVITGHILTVLRGAMYQWCVSEGDQPITEFAGQNIAFALQAFRR